MNETITTENRTTPDFGLNEKLLTKRSFIRLVGELEESNETATGLESLERLEKIVKMLYGENAERLWAHFDDDVNEVSLFLGGQIRSKLSQSTTATSAESLQT
jgi:hypothetical protein